MRSNYFLFFYLFFQCNSVVAQVHAEFNADQRSGCGVTQVKFQNLSIGSIASYHWDFGNGSTSTSIQPSKVYITPGKFKVCLTVSDTSGNQDTNCKIDYIEVNTNFIANFKATESVICAGSETSFEDVTKSPNGKIVSWIWDLNGSAGVVQQQNLDLVSSRYDIPGKYIITLHVTDEAGCRAIVSKPLLTVIPTPTVSIAIPVNTVCDTIGQINFNNTSTNSPEISYQWEFGNGQKYEGFEPPPITYQGKGQYDVQVTAIHLPTGCKTTSNFPSAVFVADLAPFSFGKSTLCLNENMIFNPENRVNLDSHLWDFGDGITSNAIVASHAYIKPGYYKVKHQIVYKGCISERTSTDSIKVNVLPTVGYKLNDTVGCMFPLKIITSNQSEGAINYSWSANGQEISTEQQPILEFPNEGNFKVGLLSTNEYGCSAYIEHKTVHVYKIKPVIINQMVKACAPLNGYTLNQLSTSIDPITQVTWTVFTPEPIVYNLPSPIVNISDTGSFKIRLLVRNSVGCADSIDYDHWIQLGKVPLTKMSLPKSACFGQAVLALDKSSGFPNEFYWGFGNAANILGTNKFQFEIDQLGTVIISHQTSHYGCNGKVITDSILANGAKADASSIIDNCAKPLQRTFINNSSGADSVHWDFGVLDMDTDQSDSTQVVYTFPKKGIYTVSLNVFNKISGCPYDHDSILVDIKEVKAIFNVDHKNGCAPQDIKVTNLSEDAVAYRFEMPGSDKNSSTEINPGFRFSTGVNTYGTLVATDIDGCSDTARIDSISIYQSIAEIMPSSGLQCQDGILTLINKSKAINDTIKRLIWTYPLRTLIDKDSINIILDTLNTPSVSLKIETVKGCTAVTSKSFAVNKLRASIQTDTLVCVKDVAVFNPTITGRWNHIQWDFGDGSTSPDIIGMHNYKSNGFYKIKVMISDDASQCKDTFLFPQLLNVGDPQALFSVSTDNSNCRPLIAKFQNKSKLVDKFEWNLGDQSGVNHEISPSHLYTKQGYFDVMLIAKSSELCRDTLIIDSAIFVTGPNIRIVKGKDRNSCLPIHVKFNTTLTNAANALIEWGDGAQDTLSEKTGKQLFQHQYREPGIYYPVLVATDINGCTDFSIVDTIIAHQAQIDIRPRDSLICGTEGDFYFNDSSRSSEIVQSIRFNIKSFGYDSTFDHIPIPFHTDQSGKYSIHYYLNNEYCSDSAQYDHLFQLSKRPAAIYQINQSEFCAGDTIQLINQSLSREVPIASFYWKDNLIDIHTDTLSNILDQGLHTYLLIAKTIAGCEDTARLDLDVKPAVFSTLSQDTIVCAGTLVTLKSIINNPVEGMSYKWSNGPTTLCLDCLEYTFRSESGSNYQFITTHPNGCVRSFSEQIKTRPNPIQNIQLTNDTSICRNVPLPLAVKVLNDVYAYTWDSTRAGLSCYTYCNNPIALPTDHTTYLVTIRDGTGCERLDSVRVRVKNSIPIDLGADRTICKNDSLQLNVLNITQPRWTGSSGISCTNCSNPFLRPIGSAKYILNALSQGCPIKDTIQINILTHDLIGGSNDTTICIGSSVLLKGLSNKISNWTPTTSLDNPNSINPIAMPISTTTYRAFAKEDLCETVDSIKVNVLTNTKIAGVNRTVCPSDLIFLSVTGEADQYQWIGADILNGQNTSRIQIKANSSAQYKVIAKNKTCVADTQTIKVEVIDFISLKDSMTLHVAANQPYQLNKTLHGSNKYIYHWSPSENLSCANCQDPVFNGNENSKYVFSILDPATSCALDQNVNINISQTCDVNDFFSVPNIFTPNQDGKNDILFPIPKITDQIKSFRVFDRVGDLIFESFDIHFGWNGLFKGVIASNGVYVYLLEAQCPQTGQSIFLSGDVTLIR